MARVNHRLAWGLSLLGVVLLPVGMTLAVVRSLAQVKAAPDGPRVVVAWASGPMEVHVAFDRAVDSAVAAPLVGQTIAFGGSADKPTDGGRPGGDGGSIRIAAARLDPDARTLVLTTDPHPRAATYTLALADLKAPGATGAGRVTAVTYSLAGIEATWTPDGATQPAWTGWLPDLDPAISRAVLAGSTEHDRLWPLLRRPGKFALRSFVRLPAGVSTSVILANVPFEATLGPESARSGADHRATLKLDPGGEPVELTATVATPVDEPNLHWLVAPADTSLESARMLPRSACEAAWAPPTGPEPAAATLPEPLARGGDPARGAIVFRSEAAKCATCHQVRGVGGQIGPNLSNLDRTSRAWVYQNIVEPSAAIHPNYVAYTVAFRDGRVTMGTVHAEGADAIRVGDPEAKFTTFPRAEVEEIRPSASSIMPVGLLQALGDERTRDLLAYLTTPEATPPGR